ncbi:MAG: hypothetical protein RLY16_1469 [Bacteroidota bacterium]|jgi:hypothetical protein
MLFAQLNQQLSLLNKLLSHLTDEQYQMPIKHLGNASIGEHTRHIIELAQCAINSKQTCVVDYINRQRNLQLQQDRNFAINQSLQIQEAMASPNQNLQLVLIPTEGVESDTISTNYFREVVYITDHTIHHFALIKVALSIMQLDLVGNDFGLAYATKQYKAQINFVAANQVEAS